MTFDPLVRALLIWPKVLHICDAGRTSSVWANASSRQRRIFTRCTTNAWNALSAVSCITFMLEILQDRNKARRRDIDECIIRVWRNRGRLYMCATISSSKTFLRHVSRLTDSASVQMDATIK